MEENYTALAQMYDEWMKDVPYRRWAMQIRKILRKYGIRKGLVCDLGCGSGKITTLLSDLGYDMTGIDRSEEMLCRAQERKKNRDILYLNQDIRSFELYGTMQAFISTCDTLNYITDPRELRKIFRAVNNYLDPGGIFIFDLHTPYYYKKVLGNRTFAHMGRHSAYIWENRYSGKSGLNEYYVNLFIRKKIRKGRILNARPSFEASPQSVCISVPEQRRSVYIRKTERHVERSYPRRLIRQELEKAGLRLLSVRDDYTNRRPSLRSTRLVYVARLPQDTVKQSIVTRET